MLIVALRQPRLRPHGIKLLLPPEAAKKQADEEKGATSFKMNNADDEVQSRKPLYHTSMVETKQKMDHDTGVNNGSQSSSVNAPKEEHLDTITKKGQ